MACELSSRLRTRRTAFSPTLPSEPSLSFRASALGHRLKNLLLARREEIRHPDLGASCDLSVRPIYAVTRTAVYRFGGAFGGDPLRVNYVVQELTRSVLAYLGVSSDEGQ
jgi:hypothetical protein